MPDASDTAQAPSSTTEPSSRYNPHAIEDRWYAYWEQNGFFDTSVNPDRQPHTIVQPPPNVTGRLHMGHALQSVIQDSLTRIRRMQGFEALWLPGIDHAGIATQNVVERLLKAETGKSRHDLGRDAFVDRIWKWKEEYGDIIVKQGKKLGSSADWSKLRFTMDEGFTRAVQTVFVKLYEEGLIYRGHYLVNWCPVDRTALSDEEVDNVERDGNLWYIRYPLQNAVLPDGRSYIVVATTRPETMLGDTAIAVHPDDERYRDLIGRTAILPLLNREIPIIADEYVKPEFGAGALKVTPAHDQNDFEIGSRHGLDVVNIMNLDGTLNENAGPYGGMERFEARKKVVEDLEALGLLERIEDYRISVPISHRSKAIIEPLISRQWFVRMKPLAEPALEAVRDGRIRFYPKRWENEYYRWLENIRDWTISRQLWWGHRIPVWYYTTESGEVDESRDFVVSVDRPEPGMVQDEDVLDTWFSSWLWPFATLGWPEDTPEVRYFHPTTVLVSGYDILFFWIARMIMASLKFVGEVPYRDIFITGMIKDKQGRWMSKSLGNGIDPLDMIEQYGADAVRYSLTVLCAQGQDIKLDPLKFEMGRNFANKIWNAFNVFGRFMEEGKDYRRKRTFDQLDLVERWMLHQLNSAIDQINTDIDRYRLNEALSRIYDLFWHDYCDWYLELIKPAPGEQMNEETIALAVELYEKLTLLLHPFMPYITEEQWWKLRPRAPREACIVAAWPQADTRETDVESARAFDIIQQMISGVRNTKAKMNVPPARELHARIKVDSDYPELAGQITSHPEYFRRLANVVEVVVGVGTEKPAASSTTVIGRSEVYVPLADLIDLDVERERLRKEIQQKEGFLVSIHKKISNEQFVSRAPADVVERERQKERDVMSELDILRSNLNDLL